MLAGSLRQRCEQHEQFAMLNSLDVPEDCWDLPAGRRDLHLFPSLWIGFEGDHKVVWEPHAYLFEVNGGSEGLPAVWCLAFAPQGGADKFVVLGISWMLNQDVIFDTPRKRLGISTEALCPEFLHRPPPPPLSQHLAAEEQSSEVSLVFHGTAMLWMVVGVLFAAALGVVAAGGIGRFRVASWRFRCFGWLWRHFNLENGDLYTNIVELPDGSHSRVDAEATAATGTSSRAFGDVRHMRSPQEMRPARVGTQSGDDSVGRVELSTLIVGHSG